MSIEDDRDQNLHSSGVQCVRIFVGWVEPQRNPTPMPVGVGFPNPRWECSYFCQPVPVMRTVAEDLGFDEEEGTPACDGDITVGTGSIDRLERPVIGDGNRNDVVRNSYRA